jgi:hypothetical protein
MKSIHPTLGAIFGSHRLLRSAVALGLLVLFGSAPNGFAQTPLPLGLSNNYMVTGDYVVGGVGLRGLGDGSGFATGTINIPDPAAYATNVPLQQVPVGADIVAAYLYWATVENSGTFAGKNGFFRGYPITGATLGNPNAPVSWSSGGCAGSSQGSKTMVAYRADVSALIPVDANGIFQPNGSYAVRLADSGKSGNVPFTLGATLVIIYRVLAPTVPLNAVVIYDGAYAPSNTAQTMTLPMLGFFQAGNDQGAAVATKITHIVGNGQPNKLQQVFLNNYDAAGNLVHSTALPSLYGTNPPFPGVYNQDLISLSGGGSWDNPTWFPNSYATTPLGDAAVQPGESSETTVVVPSSSNKGCVSWGAVIMSTTVQDSDLDGLPTVWKTNQGYCDAGANRGMSNQGTCPLNTNDPSWITLSGATKGNKDVFIQLDYMCTKVIKNANGTTTCDPSGVSYRPDPQAISNLTSAFSSNGHNIHVHPVLNDNNVILAQTCMDTVDANGNPVYCPYPGQAGAVNWKVGYSFLKTQALNYPDETSCETRTAPGGAAGTGPLCVRRFQPGQNNSYHEVIFGVASVVPNWYLQDGSLTSVAASGNTLTFTTSAPHGLAVNAAAPNGRININGAFSNPSLNGVFLVQSVPSNTSFTIQLAAATTAPTKVTDPFFSVGSGVVNAASGVSDIGGADSLISLGLWGADGGTVPVQSGTLMHELGHTLGLTHGGLFRTQVAGGYSFTFGPNCNPNFQSVMSYLFQVDLLDGVLDYSEETLPTLNEVTASASIPSVLANAIHPTTRWYAPNQPFGSPATSHCDGSSLLPADPPSFRLQEPAASITWSANQDLNFDGKIAASLQGYNDWANVELRQVGATGNDFWAGGALPYKTGSGGALPYKTGSGGALPYKTGSGGALPFKTGGGGVGEITVQAANSIVRNPTNLSATLTPATTVQLSFTAPGFGQSQIAAFNIYRSVNGAPFSKPAYATVSVTGTPLPLPNPFNFTDTKVSCATYSYFVTTVLSDGRESVPSNTAGPISVPCMFVGFLSPLSTASKAPAPPTFSGPRNLGNAVPIKWELVDTNGNPVGDLTTLKVVQACPTTGATSAPPSSTSPPCVLIFSPLTGGEGSTTFRFSTPNFIINWDTGSSSGITPGYWTVELQLSDGRTEWTNLQF